jgi:hypothetical protein
VRCFWASSSMGADQEHDAGGDSAPSASPISASPKLSSTEVVDWFYPSELDLRRSLATMALTSPPIT